MSRHVLSLLAAVAFVTAQTPTPSPTPLFNQHFPYGQQPYKVDDNPTGRGPQFGYNICNSTTEGPNSDCQTALMNHIDDFCLWAPPLPNSTIGDTEAECVAWSTKPGHGTRIMPAGTLTGVQVLKAPNYILFTATLNQQNLNLQPDDGGGELDPHGADLRGNPLGSLVYSNAFPSNNGNNNSFQQVYQWHNYMGSGMACFKICDPNVANSDIYCNNIFDRIGCNYVCPASYTPGEFTVCDSEDQDPPGVYTGSDGKTSTFSQPPESLGPISTIPFTPRIPATSNCVTYTSSLLYASQSSPSPTNSKGSSTGTSTGTGTGTVTSKPSGSTSKSGGSSSTQGSSKSGAASRSVNLPGASIWVAGSGVFVAMGMTLFAGLMTVVVAL
ncbi:uncharacterized protein EI90DRAFT_2917133 [Cantharellus anzutake]|uniref:uncharacterized protein n=1 Tax=Cantharellus anzutake TaxID=1750568 RepID=UPI0019041F7C|nr:uncharacterized protein EI90DRAFT_3147646 [Cantharellus anzutake]XP_038917340.1 uncharacterized protein EI90DRAFT_2917133 [Cantharellus anzutake]KAF8314342.1 hypothetical protein EI90DRAFT_3147646 [Cantharellus anzutake]KAF8333187.1 hypothetical protein EI90DRAFT_2917133 [Cantharellus anzutake]